MPENKPFLTSVSRGNTPSPDTPPAGPLAPSGSSKRIRLGVDFHVWDHLFQGSRSHILGLYRAAISLAPDIDFVFFLDDVEGLRRAHIEFQQPHVHLVRMPTRSGPVRLALQLPWLQWRHRIDLLHLQYKLPLLRMGPCACTIHDVLFETHPQYFEAGFARQMQHFCRQAAKKARLLLTVSDYSRQQMARLYGLPPERITLTRNAVDLTRFHPGEAGRSVVQALGLVPGQYILTVGRLEPRKNHVALIKAYAQLDASAPPLVIVGQRDFGYSAALDLIASLNLGERIRVLEEVSDVELPALLRHAQVFAYPTLAEGFGMPVLEAMASGVPVITSQLTALPEVAADAAVLVDPHSPDELAHALRMLVRDPAAAAGLRALGLQRAHQFQWSEPAQQLLHGVRACLRPAPSRL